MSDFKYKQPLSKDMKITPNQLSDSQAKPVEPVDKKAKTFYRCTNCGIIHESSTDSPPEYCPKCDNEKFYKVKK